ncbi:MAG: hypothetical protein QM669_06455 [Siphonobacter sp.]
MESVYFLYNRVISRIETFTNHSNWKLRSVLLFTGLIFLVAFPSYDRFFTTNHDYYEFWQHLSRQVDHPFTQQTGLAPASHEAKTTFRLVAPLAGKLVGWISPMAGVWFMFLVQHLLGFLFMHVVLTYAYRLTANRVTSFLFLGCLSCIYLTRSFFYELYGLFDGYAFAFIMLAVVARSPIQCMAALFFAFWTDERAIVASPLVLLYQLSVILPTYTFTDLLKQWKWYGSYVILIAVYAALRFFLMSYFHLDVPLGDDADAGLSLIYRNILELPLATFLTYEGCWLIIGWLFVYYCYKRAWWEIVLYGSMTIVVWVVAGSVLDFTRSFCYGFPLLMLGFYEMTRHFTASQLQKYLFIVLTISVMIPTYKYIGDFYWHVPAPLKLFYYVMNA